MFTTWLPPRDGCYMYMLYIYIYTSSAFLRTHLAWKGASCIYRQILTTHPENCSSSLSLSYRPWWYCGCVPWLMPLLLVHCSYLGTQWLWAEQVGCPSLWAESTGCLLLLTAHSSQAVVFEECYQGQQLTLVADVSEKKYSAQLQATLVMRYRLIIHDHSLTLKLSQLWSYDVFSLPDL